MFKLNYGSVLQSELEQDIETTEFGGNVELLTYLDDRIDKHDAFVFIALTEGIFTKDDLEMPSCNISRRLEDIISYVKNKLEFQDARQVFVFEYRTYKEALDYFQDICETSSIGG